MLSIANALLLAKETSQVDFKSTFDLSSRGEWCELIKDIIAMHNSGGGILLIGVGDDGSPITVGSESFLSLDPSDLDNRFSSYTGHSVPFALSIEVKESCKVLCISISTSDKIVIPTSPGTYQLPSGKQTSAFSSGVVYIRRGVKSCPATTNDLDRLIARRVSMLKRFWLSGVRKIVQATPPASVSITSGPLSFSTDPSAPAVRITSDPSAPTVRLLNPDETHPYRAKEFTALIHKKHQIKLSVADIQLLRLVYALDKQPEFIYAPKYGPRRYSDKLLEWIIKNIQHDRHFLRYARLKKQRLAKDKTVRV